MRTLLSDFTGPCYVPCLPDALKVALHEVSNSLDLADCTARWGTDSSRRRNPVPGGPR